MSGSAAPGAQHDDDDSAELAALRRRVESLEAELAALKAALGPVPAVPPDVVIAISAAVAAFLGKRATVRRIHLAGESTWAHEGRAYVQGSHAAARRR